jgi:hypothetical protein
MTGGTYRRHCEGFSPWQSLVFKGLLRRFTPRNDEGFLKFKTIVVIPAKAGIQFWIFVIWILDFIWHLDFVI